MRTDCGDNLWFTNFEGHFISKLDHKTRAITKCHTCCPLSQGAFPGVLRASSWNLKYLWANAFGGGGFIRPEPDTPDDNQKFKIFTDPTGAGTFQFENANDFCGRIWSSSPTLTILVYEYLAPALNRWTTVDIPNTGVKVTSLGMLEPGEFSYKKRSRANEQSQSSILRLLVSQYTIIE
jgi:hypothetical protein